MCSTNRDTCCVLIVSKLRTCFLAVVSFSLSSVALLGSEPIQLLFANRICALLPLAEFRVTISSTDITIGLMEWSCLALNCLLCMLVRLKLKIGLNTSSWGAAPGGAWGKRIKRRFPSLLMAVHLTLKQLAISQIPDIGSIRRAEDTCWVTLSWWISNRVNVRNSTSLDRGPDITTVISEIHLRDWLVSGVHHPEIQKNLLVKQDLAFAESRIISDFSEAAAEHSVFNFEDSVSSVR